MRFFSLVALALSLAAPAQAGNWADDPEYAQHAEFATSRRICDQLRRVELPDAKRPDRREQGGMAGCRSEALYYGIGVPVDAKAAFACALLEADDMFAGDMMLMTMYANGKGVAVDLDKAVALACVGTGAPMEIHYRVQSLTQRRGVTPTAEFHWCDDITSGLNMSWCAAHAARFDEATQAEDVKAFRRHWHGGEAAVRLEALLAAAKDFVSVRGNEVDQSGTARGALVIEAEAEIKRLLNRDLHDLAGSREKLALAANDQDADAELNRVYKRVMAYDFGNITGSITPTSIRGVQRVWLKYRDAWVAFAKVAAPGTAPQAMANLQTRHRIAQLLELIGETP